MPRQRFILLVLLASALLGALLWRGRRPGPLRERGLSVLLLTIDTLRADALGAYGNAKAATPWMDRLAASGVRFGSAHAHNVVTLPSHANILSGRHPTDHGVRDNAGFRFPSRLPTLATILHERGYATGAFVSAFPLDSRFGLDRGFDVYDDSFLERGARPAFLEQERPGSETVALARRWLDAQRGPSLCWVHVYEPHFPYAPPDPWAARFPREPYAGEVAAADAALQPLLDPLLAAGETGRTLVVLTSDHGEALGEHGEKTHGILAYEATLRVPLLLYAPRILGPRVVSAPARHVDVLPTILDALSLPIPEGLPGRSLLAVAAGTGAPSADPSYFEALSGALNRGWAPLHGVIRGRAKYVDLPIPELYDLESDPGEVQNLVASRQPLLAEMRALLAGLRSADHGFAPGPESAETLERLRSLGYVASAAPPKARYTEADDPKGLMDVDSELQEVAALYLSGDLEGALLRCRELVSRRPGMPASLLYLAQLQREGGQLEAAIETLQSLVALDPGDTTAVTLLGACLTEAGRAGPAADLLGPYASREAPDLDVLTTRSLALARMGRFDEALATLRKAREVDSSSALVLVTLGTVRLMGEDRPGAREAFEAAVAQNPGAARGWSSLGVVAAQEGHADEAVAHWRKSLALDPREGARLFGLASALWRAGRRAEARPYLECFVAAAPPASYSREVEQARAWLGTLPPRG